jgi:DNA-binding XRE family transcriptional regulator
MCAKRVFGKVRLTREEREADRRIREAASEAGSLDEFERKIGPGEPVDDVEASVFRSSLGHKIGLAREDAGLTRADLAELVGVEEAEITRLETGAPDAGIETLARIVKALRLKVTVASAT